MSKYIALECLYKLKYIGVECLSVQWRSPTTNSRFFYVWLQYLKSTCWFILLWSFSEKCKLFLLLIVSYFLLLILIYTETSCFKFIEFQFLCRTIGIFYFRKIFCLSFSLRTSCFETFRWNILKKRIVEHSL